MKTAQQILDENGPDEYCEGAEYSQSLYSYDLVLQMLQEMEDQYMVKIPEEKIRLILDNPKISKQDMLNLLITGRIPFNKI